MTKRRPPLSIDAALARVAGQLENGWDDMGAACETTPAYLRACGDPDRREKLSIDNAIALDLAFEAGGGEGYPLFEAYQAQLDLAAAASFASNFDLLRRTARVIKEGGEAHSALARACLPDATLDDRREALRELSEAYEEIRPVLALLSGVAAPDEGAIRQLAPSAHQRAPP